MKGAGGPLRLGVVGAGGHMGRRVCALVQHAAAAAGPGLRLAATLHRSRPTGSAPTDGVLATTDVAAFAAAVDVAIDFSAPATAATLAPMLAQRGVAYVVASTGLSPQAEAALAAAATRAPVLVAANTSLGVWVLAEAVRHAAALWPQADVEVVEVHHSRKRDAPSGTALALGEAVRAGWTAAEGEKASAARGTVCGRGPGDPPRQTGELGYSAVRGGDVVGEHTVYLLAAGERIELTHRCTNADTFARGALQAAAWLGGRRPGRYVFADVLGRRAP